jgi:hypothetical protein
MPRVSTGTRCPIGFVAKTVQWHFVCVYYCSTYYKAVRVGGGGTGRTCDTRDYEPRPKNTQASARSLSYRMCVCLLFQCRETFTSIEVQLIPADMRLRVCFGLRFWIPNFRIPDFDSVNLCTSKEISMEMWQR